VPGQSAIRPEEKICLAALAGDRFAFLFAFDLECDVDELVFLAADEFALACPVQQLVGGHAVALGLADGVFEECVLNLTYSQLTVRNLRRCMR